MVTNEVPYLVRGIMRIIPPAIRRLSILVSHFLPVSWLLHTLIYEERIFGKNHQCLAKIFIDIPGDLNSSETGDTIDQKNPMT